MFKQPSWEIPGLVGEARELVSSKEKGSQVWAYAVKLVGMGGTFETQTKDHALYTRAKALVGKAVAAVGGFEQYNGQVRLQLTNIAETKGVA